MLRNLIGKSKVDFKKARGEFVKNALPMFAATGLAVAAGVAPVIPAALFVLGTLNTIGAVVSGMEQDRRVRASSSPAPALATP